MIILDQECQLVLQLRDNKPGIDFPGYLSLFAGRGEVDESPFATVHRELREEIAVRDGGDLRLLGVGFLLMEVRDDRPWDEFVFVVMIDHEWTDLVALEGKAIRPYLKDIESADRIAPHHARYIDRFEQVRVEMLATIRDNGGIVDIQNYINRFTYESVKDYAYSENGRGFVVPGLPPVASISPDEPTLYIALLNFPRDEPRGNHYHLAKVETMTVLAGRLRCQLRLRDDPLEQDDFILNAGDGVRILPGCIHTYTALDGDVSAIELSPQALRLADQYEVDPF